MKPIHEPASLPLPHRALALARLRRQLPITSRVVPAGGLLVAEDQTLPGVLVVDAGLLAAASTALSGKRAVLALLRPGDVLAPDAAGRRAPPGRPPFQMELRALIDTRALLLPTVDLAEAVRRDPLLQTWLLEATNGVVTSLMRTLARSLALPVRDRLLDVLSELASAVGSRIGSWVRISIPLAQEELGAMVGATRESVNRALRELSRAGLVRRYDGSYLVAAAAAGDGPGLAPSPMGELGGSGRETTPTSRSRARILLQQ
jgi:CRP/FNR family cyclic AMP-dependent transcriptional regulator